MADKGEEVTAGVIVVVLTPDRKNWKNSMMASRACGGNICKRVTLRITRR